jgi:hypothetical protein
MASWSATDRLKARENACKGTFRPVVYKVEVDDTHNQWRYEVAARALGVNEVSSLIFWCTEVVIRRNPLFKEARRIIRQRETELRRQRRKRAREERAARRAALKAWKGPKVLR